MTAPTVIPAGEGWGDIVQKGAASFINQMNAQRELQQRQQQINQQQQQLDQAQQQAQLTGLNIKSEVKKREAELEAANIELAGQHRAAALYGQLTQQGLEPDSPEWNHAYQVAAKGDFGKDYHAAMQTAFEALSQQHITTKSKLLEQQHVLAQTQLAQAQAEAAKRKEAQDNSATLSPGQVLVNKQTGKVVATGPEAKASTDQMNQAEMGAAALKTWQAIDKLRQRKPGVEQEVGAILTSPAYVKAVPGFKGATDAVQAAQKAGASKEAQAYLRLKWAFMDNIIRTRIAGGRMSGAIYSLYANELLPGNDPGGFSVMRDNEIQSILSAVGKSGYDLNPKTWDRAAKRHGVEDIDLGGLMSGGTADPALDSIMNDPRYK